jgi:hypothetical protein
MEFRPMQNMFQRVKDDSQDGDVGLFNALMYAGEMALKLTVLAVLAGLDEESRDTLYHIEYDLVRANDLSKWTKQLDILLSDADNHIAPKEVSEDWAELVRKSDSNSWQYKCVADMNQCVREALREGPERLSRTVSLRSWMDDFVRLRNKVKAHGAPTSATLGRICKQLQDSIESYTTNCSIFNRPWAYLHRSFSGRYQVVSLGGDQEVFSYLKTASADIVGDDGIYTWYGRPTRVPLVQPGEWNFGDLSLPNGGYKDGKYETICYVNDYHGKVAGFFEPYGELPPSETAGLGTLEVIGKTFSNMPAPSDRYVDRPDLEKELEDRVTDDSHCIITLYGKGGIGKTWATLHVLRKVASTDRFAAILWFSARDLDLLPQGPKRVAPDHTTEGDLARTFVDLAMGKANRPKESQARAVMQSYLHASPVGPLLFVFDNFETLSDPLTAFSWIDTYVRPPNKVLITTRNQSFRGDYPVEVTGMTPTETRELIRQTSFYLKIEPLLTEDYVEKIVNVVGGHPYIVNMVLSEVDRLHRLVPPETMITHSSNILDVLFERSYKLLSPAAREVFMLVATSKLAVPVVAVEAAVLGYAKEPIDVKQAIDELHRSSFIEWTAPNSQQHYFVSAPTVAAAFGKKKLAVYQDKSRVDLETEFLRKFGPTQASELSQGWDKSTKRLMHNLDEMTNHDTTKLQKYIQMIEYVAQEYNPVWLMLAELYEGSPLVSDMNEAKECVRRYLQHAVSTEEQDVGWRRLQRLCYNNNDWHGELQTWAEWVQLVAASGDTLSLACGRVRYMISRSQIDMSQDDVMHMVRQLAEVAFSRINELDAKGRLNLASLMHSIGDYQRSKSVLQSVEEVS